MKKIETHQKGSKREKFVWISRESHQKTSKREEFTRNEAKYRLISDWTLMTNG